MGIKQLFLILCGVLAAGRSLGQYPIQVMPQLTPPYSLQLNDYYNSTVPKLAVVLTDRDLTRPSVNVRLKMTIAGQSATVSTIDNAYYPPITLDAGIPVRLTGSELSPYFNPDNLSFQGITKAQYVAQGQLPEGYYQFCFQAIETTTGRAVSSNSCAMAWLDLSDPPLLNLPSTASNVAFQDPLNIVFSWTPRNSGNPNSAFSTTYDFALVEITDTTVDPTGAFTMLPPLYTATTQATTFLYGPGQPTLLTGHRYAWRVQAQAMSNGQQLSLFRNNGYSNVNWFTLEDNCQPPLSGTAVIQGGGVHISWIPQSPMLDYEVDYRLQGADTAAWFTQMATADSVVIYDVSPGQTYEYRIGGACSVAGGTTYGNVQAFTIPASDTIGNPNCGILPNINIANQAPLPALNINDVFMAGDFPVKVLTTSGANGRFTGTGYVTVPFLGQAMVKVGWTSAGINTDHKLISGVVMTAFDPSAKQVANADSVIQTIGGLINTLDSFLNNYTGSPQDQQQATVYQQKLDSVAGAIINNPNIPDSVKQPLIAAQNMGDSALKNYETATPCPDSTSSQPAAAPSNTNGPNASSNFDPDYSCNKAAVQAYASVAQQVSQQVSNAAYDVTTLVIDKVWSANGNPTSATAYLGLTPDGKIITQVNLRDATQSAAKAVSRATPYVIMGFQIYQDGNVVDYYKWQSGSGGYGYYDKSGAQLNLTLSTDKGYVNVYQLTAGNCTYYVQPVQWQYGPGDVQGSLAQLVNNSQWQTELIYNADPSCVKEFAQSILSKDASPDCQDQASIDSNYALLMQYVNKTKTDKEGMVATINGVCKSALTQLTYTQLMELFTPLASSKKIKEAKEVAVLRLMSCIDTAHYSAFYSLLEENGNSLIRNLVDQMDDASVYSSDGDNYTNFMGVLATMYHQNPGSWINRMPADDGSGTSLLTQVLNLSAVNYTSTKTTDSASGVLTLRNSNRYFSGTYNSSDGTVTLNEISQTIIYRPAAVLSANPVVTTTPLTVLTPMTPIIIRTGESLPLVTTALTGDAITPGGNTYVVPAIFLKYGDDKAMNKAVGTTVFVALDLLTIYASGGVALAAEVSTVRRMMALVELTGAAGNIAVNTGAIPEGTGLYNTVQAYNIIMGLIGIKNLGTGVVNFAKNLPDATRAILQQKGNLRTLLQDQYATFKASLKAAREDNSLKNAGDATKNAIKQEEQALDEIMAEAKAAMTAEEATALLKQELGEEIGGILSEDPVFTAKGTDVGWLNKYIARARLLLQNDKFDQALANIQELSQGKLLQNTGNADFLELAAINRYTINGDILNKPLRAAIPPASPAFSDAEQALYNEVTSGMDKLKKTNRLTQDYVFRGRTMTQAEYDALFQGDGYKVPLKGFVSTSKEESVTTVFTGKTATGAPGEVTVVMKIKSAAGVYIDDISDWGINFVKQNHPGEMQQEEVLLKQGYYQQVGTPQPKTFANGQPYLEVTLQELGQPLN